MEVPYDTYSSYNDSAYDSSSTPASYESSSNPRTPSPEDFHHQPVHSNNKHILHHIPSIPSFDHHNHHQHNVEESHTVPTEFAAPHWNNPRSGPMLHDLYKEQPHAYAQDYPEHHRGWQEVDDSAHHPSHQQQHPSHSMPRRATFPYVRHDSREEVVPASPYPPPYMNDSPNHLINPFAPQHHHQQRSNYYPSPQLPHNRSPPTGYMSPPSSHVKLEDPHHSPLMLPHHPPYYGSPGPYHLPTGLSHHTGIPVQHTDDAASKETQYLRRRCFNCHTTEPPSWRRSTLNPGKIVCNKCGLYERTHLRPRPLRFDELRAGNKARKQSLSGPKPALGKSSKSSSSPTSVKKEPGDFNQLRARSGSVSSAGANSDWDDSVSVYSSGSAPPTSFNSPAIHTFPIPRSSASPPSESGAIRLPNAGLNDIGGLSTHSDKVSSSPNLSPDQLPCSPPHQFYRRDSMPELRASLDVQVAS
ncbi:hypothetical protein BDV98DRAFT_580047 [Pterulicium gracile]|uniref:GATA-type domain-containing protein n=1 Tax=Pterulicium gracile TaxID=1884261 RepID=A0A5C3QVE1_9AGAR|nr:hypothetical protein BDV98DRAFT_580047 [Pterula gracilis]